MGERIIYVATPMLGFEIDGIPQNFRPRQLSEGIFKCDEQVCYIPITEIIEGVLTATKAIRLLNKIYMFNTSTQKMEEEDFADVDVEIIQSKIENIIRFEKNTYVKKFRFDCIRENDQQDGSYQPISGLLTSSSYITLKTHNFPCANSESPQHEDLLYFQGAFWIIEEVNKTYTYEPKERVTLHLALKALNK